MLSGGLLGFQDLWTFDDLLWTGNLRLWSLGSLATEILGNVGIIKDNIGLYRDTGKENGSNQYPVIYYNVYCVDVRSHMTAMLVSDPKMAKGGEAT